MTQQNSSRFGTAFTETIEAREGVTTGISAADRAHTIRTAIDPGATAADLARPGHVFPLRARRGGVLVRAGQTEASVDLARLAGLTPAGVICEIMRDDGEMARIPDLIPFCREHGLRILTVAELIRYRLRHERYIVRAGESRIQTRYGEFRMIAYESEVQGGESHIALIRGDLCPDCPAFHAGPAAGPLPDALNAALNGAASTTPAEPRPPCPHPVLVRVHTRCTAGDVFAADCHCREILDQSMRIIAEAGCGVILYLHNTSRGFDIDHTPAARLQSRGLRRPRRRHAAGYRPPHPPSGTARPRRLPGPHRPHPPRHRPRRPDPLRSGNPAHPPALQHPHAHPRPRRLRPRNRRAGPHPRRGVLPRRLMPCRSQFLCFSMKICSLWSIWPRLTAQSRSKTCTIG